MAPRSHCNWVWLAIAFLFILLLFVMLFNVRINIERFDDSTNAAVQRLQKQLADINTQLQDPKITADSKEVTNLRQQKTIIEEQIKLLQNLQSLQQQLQTINDSLNTEKDPVKIKALQKTKDDVQSKINITYIPIRTAESTYTASANKAKDPLVQSVDVGLFNDETTIDVATKNYINKQVASLVPMTMER
jgi:hypothetical protein